MFGEQVVWAIEPLAAARRRITRPAEQPQALAREEWATDWQQTTLDAIMLPPSVDDVASVVLDVPAIPEYAGPASEASAVDGSSAHADRPNQ